MPLILIFPNKKSSFCLITFNGHCIANDGINFSKRASFLYDGIGERHNGQQVLCLLT